MHVVNNDADLQRFYRRKLVADREASRKRKWRERICASLK